MKRKVLFLLPIACCLFALIACAPKVYNPTYTHISFNVLFKNGTTQNDVAVSISKSRVEVNRAFTTYPESVKITSSQKAGINVSYYLIDGDGVPFYFYISQQIFGGSGNIEPKCYKRSNPYIEVPNKWDIRSNCTFTLQEDSTGGSKTYKLFLEDQ